MIPVLMNPVFEGKPFPCVAAGNWLPTEVTVLKLEETVKELQMVMVLQN